MNMSKILPLTLDQTYHKFGGVRQFRDKAEKKKKRDIRNNTLNDIRTIGTCNED